jgi:hypothetical protein
MHIYNHKKLTISVILLILICFPLNALSYDDQETHPKLTEKAVKKSNLNSYLISNLSITEGIDKSFTGGNKNYSILKWLMEGAKLEDSPNCRASNHFHDPTKTWSLSYMTDQSSWLDYECSAWKPWYSNVTWATGFLAPAPDGSKASYNTHPDYAPVNWDKARQYYYYALTSTLTESRETYSALTFESLGNVMHLLEDVSVPAHVRNDFTSHLTFNGINSIDPTRWFGNPFEHYVKSNPSLITTSNPVMPVFLYQSLTKFWDIDQYNGSNPTSSLDIGLSEYTNANFLSDSTIFREPSDSLHSYPFPALSSVEEYEEIDT